MFALDTTLRALHPMMHFITEDIWQRLPREHSEPRSIMISRYPEETDVRNDEEAEATLRPVRAVITQARTVRAEHNLPRSKSLSIALEISSPDLRASVESLSPLIASLCNATVTFDPTSSTGQQAIAVQEGIRIAIDLEGLVDPQKELERLERDLRKIEKDLDKVQKKLGNEKFIAKAPDAVVEEERQRLRLLTSKREELQAARAALATH